MANELKSMIINLHRMLMNLSVSQIDELLQDEGYSENNLRSAKFVRQLGSGHYLYKITYLNIENELETGDIFVKVHDGKISADF